MKSRGPQTDPELHVLLKNANPVLCAEHGVQLYGWANANLICEKGCDLPVDDMLDICIAITDEDGALWIPCFPQPKKEPEVPIDRMSEENPGEALFKLFRRRFSQTWAMDLDNYEFCKQCWKILAVMEYTSVPEDKKRTFMTERIARQLNCPAYLIHHPKEWDISDMSQTFEITELVDEPKRGVTWQVDGARLGDFFFWIHSTPHDKHGTMCPGERGYDRVLAGELIDPGIKLREDKTKEPKCANCSQSFQP